MYTLSTNFYDLVEHTCSAIQAFEKRKNKRSEREQEGFEAAVKYILELLWKSHQSYPYRLPKINLNKNYYSSSNIYKKQDLTYRILIENVYLPLQKMGWIKEERKGYNDRSGEGNSDTTWFKPSYKLKQTLESLEGHSSITIKPDLTMERIILRNEEGRNISYTHNAVTRVMQENLLAINTMYQKHHIDLRIMDNQYKKLSCELLQKKKNNRRQRQRQLDFSRKVLARIFNDSKWGVGGRFYNGWWQEIPSKYRKYITIDEGYTIELDYSALHPHIVYFQNDLELRDDAYTRILLVGGIAFTEENRKIVKQVFNAMLNAKRMMIRQPRGLDLKPLRKKWSEIVPIVLQAHHDIQHMFFGGYGGNLQYEDSCMAEDVLLAGVKENIVTLPVHDSFIVRRQHEDFLRHQMIASFVKRWGRKPKINESDLIQPLDYFDEMGEARTEEIAKEDRLHSKWYDRNVMWMHREI